LVANKIPANGEKARARGNQRINKTRAATENANLYTICPKEESPTSREQRQGRQRIPIGRRIAIAKQMRGRIIGRPMITRRKRTR
jgi:hypothetical protein